jgi:flavodoxin I
MSVLIIYSTIGGNTEIAVKKTQQQFEEKGVLVEVKRVDVSTVADFASHSVIILASPTYGQGSVESHFIPFLASFKTTDISSYHFAIIGLGDTKYYPEYLTESAGILEDSVKKAGGSLIVPSLRIGMPPLKFINRLVPNWVDKIITISLSKSK